MSLLNGFCFLCFTTCIDLVSCFEAFEWGNENRRSVSHASPSHYSAAEHKTMISSVSRTLPRPWCAEDPQSARSWATGNRWPAALQLLRRVSTAPRVAVRVGAKDMHKHKHKSHHYPRASRAARQTKTNCPDKQHDRRPCDFWMTGHKLSLWMCVLARRSWASERIQVSECVCRRHTQRCSGYICAATWNHCLNTQSRLWCGLCGSGAEPWWKQNKQGWKQASFF